MQKLYISLITIFVYCNAFSQSIAYNISPSQRITNFNHVFTYNKYFVYDDDFKSEEKINYGDFKFLIEINSQGTGRLVRNTTGESKRKITQKIISCYQRKYANSSNLFWEIETEGAIVLSYSDFYCIDIRDNSFGDLWEWLKSTNMRVYYTNE